MASDLTEQFHVILKESRHVQTDVKTHDLFLFET